MADRVKTAIYEKNGVELEDREEYALDAEKLYFDNTLNGFAATDIQAAIEEVGDQVGVSASPGFSWGNVRPLLRA